MVRLSVNVNKVATVRNARGGTEPSVEAAVKACLDAGARGITIHPRSDARHITSQDVDSIAALLAPLRSSVELNIEGDPRPDLLDMVLRVRPHQCTLVPVRPGEITSEAGWSASSPRALVEDAVRKLRDVGVRVSLFVEPKPEPIDWAADVGADRVELYTEPYARAFERGERAANESFARYAAAAEHAHERSLGVNAGHDLDLHNLPLFRTLPHLDEVSIGHALIARALFVGLATVVREYLDLLAED
ncbi:MAG: pyridoxine 5'-phosphate synthase [Myxococcales bacterium]|nr:pyridoxine 5'-phosphate synthase [Myxococcales bacterium]